MLYCWQKMLTYLHHFATFLYMHGMPCVLREGLTSSSTLHHTAEIKTTHLRIYVSPASTYYIQHNILCKVAKTETVAMVCQIGFHEELYTIA